MRRGARCREELLTECDVRLHRAADVDQQKHAHLGASLRAQLDLELAAIFCGGIDRPLEIELGQRPFAHKGPQSAQRELNLSNVEVEIAAQRGKIPIARSCHRAATTARPFAERDATWMLTRPAMG